MPYNYILEMICDWWTFSWQKKDLFEIFIWYNKHKDYMKLSDTTRKTVEKILDAIRKKLTKEKESDSELYHHGIKGQKWGVKNGPPYPIDRSDKGDTMNDIYIGKSVGAKSLNYDILDPESGEYFHFSEGTRIRDIQVFAGKGGSRPLKPEVKEGLAEQIGGDPDKWQHCKGIGTIDYYGEDIDAEVHWFQEPSVGKHKFKIKEWKE